MHGGIGRSIHSVEQIEKLERPITMDAGSIILMDLLWFAFFQLKFSFAIYICFDIFYYLAGSLTYGYYDICTIRSDPTENDSVEGLRPNARGPGLVTFGVCMLLFT